MRKNFLWLLIILIFGMTAACIFYFNRLVQPSDKETEAEVLRLEIWYPWTDKNELFERAFLQAVSEYNEAHADTELVPYGMEMELYREKLPADIASNDTPDIYYCLTGSYLENIVNSGRILNLTPYLTETYSDRLIPGSLSGMTFEGKTYGLGFAATAGVFLVNTEMFARAGISIPDSWETFLEVCRQFTEMGVVPLACSEDSDIGFRMYLEAICTGEAGSRTCLDVIAGRQKPDDRFVNGVYKFMQLVEMGAFGDISKHQNTYEIEEEFYLSRIPMYYTKNNAVGRIQQQNNPLYGKIDLIPFPGTDGMEIAGGVTDCFVINAATEYPQEGVCALQEILHSFSQKLYENQSAVPVWKHRTEGGPDDAADYLTAEKQDADGELYIKMSEMITQAENVFPFWEISVSGERRMQYMKLSRELFHGEISAEEFLTGLSGTTIS